MFSQSVVRVGLILAGVTLLLFFGLYLLYTNILSISSRDYFWTSAVIICFILPILYTAFGFSQILKHAKHKAQTFREGFRLSFITQIIGGIISAAVIFTFFNTIGVWAEENLKYEWLDIRLEQINTSDLEKQEKEKLLNEVEELKKYSENIFSFWQFLKFVPLLTLFYIVISAILAMFMKNRSL